MSSCDSKKHHRCPPNEDCQQSLAKPKQQKPVSQKCCPRYKDYIRKYVLDMMDCSEVFIISKSCCPQCTMSKKIFEDMCVPFRCLDLDEHKDPETLTEILEEETGTRYVPKIFINSECVGGYDDLKKLSRSGKLEKMLETSDRKRRACKPSRVEEKVEPASSCMKRYMARLEEDETKREERNKERRKLDWEDKKTCWCSHKTKDQQEKECCDRQLQSSKRDLTGFSRADRHHDDSWFNPGSSHCSCSRKDKSHESAEANSCPCPICQRTSMKEKMCPFSHCTGNWSNASRQCNPNKFKGCGPEDETGRYM